MRSIGGCCLSLAVAMLTGLTLADDPVSVEAVRFTGFDGCSSDQQKKIEQAFDDAIDMSNYVYNKVDFSGQAEEEFFGPQYYNKDAQDNIKKLINKASYFDRPYFWNPFGFFIHITCDDFARRCRTSGAAAYTVNENKSPFQNDKFPWINFCPNFFKKLEGCKSVIDKYAKSKRDDFRLNLQNYQCQGYAFLHETYHLHELSDVGTQGLIKDQKFEMYDHDLNKNRVVPAYGPLFTKVLARWPGKDVAKWVPVNADNFAQYSLAKYVTSKTTNKQYPKYPIADSHPTGKDPSPRALFSFDNGALTVANWSLMSSLATGPILTDLDDDDSALSVCSNPDSGNDDNGCAPGDPLKITDFSKGNIDYSQEGDPAPYDTDTSGFEAEALQPDNFKCYQSTLDSTGQPFANSSWAHEQVKEFCPNYDSDGPLLLNSTTTNLTVQAPVDPGKGWTLYMSAMFNEGDPGCKGKNTNATTAECKQFYGDILDKCNVGDDAHKNGGYSISNCIVWSWGIDGKWDD